MLPPDSTTFLVVFLEAIEDKRLQLLELLHLDLAHGQVFRIHDEQSH